MAQERWGESEILCQGTDSLATQTKDDEPTLPEHKGEEDSKITTKKKVTKKIRKKSPKQLRKKKTTGHPEEETGEPIKDDIDDDIDDDGNSDEIPEKKRPAKKETKPRKEDESREDSKEWKKHLKKYKQSKTRVRFLGLVIGVLIIIACILGYVYFYQIDTDGDGIPDSRDSDDDNDDMPDEWEVHYGFDPKDPDDARKDEDGDRLTNVNEFKFDSDPLNEDTDKDGLNDWDEWDARKVWGKSTNPKEADSDHDGTSDSWEVINGFNPTVDDSDLDSDKDGFDANGNGKLDVGEFYTNLEEYQNKTDPNNPDTDGDGMWDGWETYFREECLRLKIKFQNYYSIEEQEYNYTFNPNDPSDAKEDIDVHSTNSKPQFAPDGLTNLQEFRNKTEPTNPDTDGDNLTDFEEVVSYETDPLYWDTDSDGLWDGWEVRFGGRAKGLDPKSNDTDSDGITDEAEDLDGDQLHNWIEHISDIGTSPIIWDTDGDGMPDGWEVFNGTNQLMPDSQDDIDLDMLTNLEEFENRTRPNNYDTDGDGLTDGEEILIGFHGELIEGKYNSNSNAKKYYTDATTNDTDSDGINDTFEVRELKTNASSADTDGDGILDPEELAHGKDGFITNPRSDDTDNDFLTDKDEIDRIWGYNTKPTKADEDNDGLLDGEEIFTDFFPFQDIDTTVFGCIDTGKVDGTNPTDWDTDDDGLPDGWENKNGFATLDMKFPNGKLTYIKSYDQRYGTTYFSNLSNNPEVNGVWLINPLNPSDRDQDADNDGYSTDLIEMISNKEEFNNSEEYEMGTDPLNWDTDNDSMSDGWEYTFWLDYQSPNPNNPNDADLDYDRDFFDYLVNGKKYVEKFTNLDEYLTGEDTNGDGIIDYNTTHPHRWHSNPSSSKSDYEEIWKSDPDGDGLFTGWELIFNGTPLDPDGYKPKTTKPGYFDPNLKDSDNDSTNDGQEDYDKDLYVNLDEQGYEPGNDRINSSDPLDSGSDPFNKGSIRHGGSRGMSGQTNGISTTKLVKFNSLSNIHINGQSNIYTENIYEKYLLTTSYQRIMVRIYENLKNSDSNEITTLISIESSRFKNSGGKS
jgi:hypothetical protein